MYGGQAPSPRSGSGVLAWCWRGLPLGFGGPPRETARDVGGRWAPHAPLPAAQYPGGGGSRASRALGGGRGACAQRQRTPCVPASGVAMCYVIVTARSLLWSLLSIGACLGMLVSIPAPTWLTGFPRKVAGNVTFSPSAGVYTRCAWVSGKELCGSFAAEGLATSTMIFPGCWKASLVLLLSGLAVASMSALASILAICKQALCKKSIFTIAGAAQAVAAILYILGLVLYPGGWGSVRAQRLCGEDAAPFFPAECSLGWGFYAAVGSMGLTLLCALLSMQAEIATSSDKVEFQIQQGRSLICLW